mgnify:CR=1 FL=1
MSIDFIRWAGFAITHWPGLADPGVPVHHIHGTRDWVIPISRLRTPPTHVVQGGAGLDVATFAGQHLTEFVLGLGALRFLLDHLAQHGFGLAVLAGVHGLFDVLGGGQGPGEGRRQGQGEARQQTPPVGAGAARGRGFKGSQHHVQGLLQAAGSAFGACCPKLGCRLQNAIWCHPADKQGLEKPFKVESI